MTGQAARLVVGQVNFTTGNFGATNSLLGSPSGLAYANGILWVADANRLGATPDNNRVLRFSDVGTYPTPTQDPTIIGSTCGVCRGQADLVLGQPDFVSANPSIPPAPTGLRNPTGIATDGNVLAVADTDNNRILIWLTMPKVNGQPADVVIGQTDFSHNATSVPPTATSLRGPTGLWIAGGKLYVADSQDDRILIYNKIPTTNHVAADVVVGQPNFTSYLQQNSTQTNMIPAANNMQTPVSVTTDGTRMYVSDLGQSRVLIYNTIPTTNGASADVAVGQPDLISAVDNNSYTVTNATLNADNDPEGAVPSLCHSDAVYAAHLGQTGTSAVDSLGATIFPARCAATLSFPRYALSDGTRLFIADGGNDRVLVYNSIPAKSGARADVILGEPDEFTDNTGQNPSGSDAFQTPDSLVWDGANNLFVSDTYNRRVVVYSPGLPTVPLAAARNAASLNIYAIGSVSFAGAISAKDEVTVGIGATCTAGATSAGCYTYTVQATDTLTTVAAGLAKLIDTKPDPNVSAGVDFSTNTLVLTAHVSGQPGASIALMATVSVNAQIVATASGANLNIYLQSPTSIAPGTLITLQNANGGLCDGTGTGDTTQPYLPGTLAGCELFIDGQRAPLLYVSPTQINAQMPWEYGDRTSVSLYSRITHADGSITVSTPISVTIVPQNPGIFAQPGTDPRPGIVFHGSSSAVDGIAFFGSTTAGDKDTVTIGGNAYTYTVLAADTLNSVAQAFVKLINNAPDPNVVASMANEFATIVLKARIPGPSGETIAVSQSVSTNATETITVYSPRLCCDNIQGALVTAANPAIPSEILYVFATGLGPTSPADQNTGQIYQGTETNPPATPVDSILAGGTSANIFSAALVPGLAGVYYVEFQLSAGQVADSSTQLTIAQQAFVSNVVTFPVVVPPTITVPATAATASSRPARPERRFTSQR